MKDGRWMIPQYSPGVIIPQLLSNEKVKRTQADDPLPLEKLPEKCVFT